MGKSTEPHNGEPSPFLSFRITPEQRHILCEDAECSGMSVSDYIRVTLFDAPPPKKRKRNKQERQDAAIIARFLGDQGKIGSNLNQLVKQVNTAAKSGDVKLYPSEETILSILQDLLTLMTTIESHLTNPSSQDHDH
jgi:hypothetical protein